MHTKRYLNDLEQMKVSGPAHWSDAPIVMTRLLASICYTCNTAMFSSFTSHELSSSWASAKCSHGRRKKISVTILRLRRMRLFHDKWKHWELFSIHPDILPPPPHVLKTFFANIISASRNQRTFFSPCSCLAKLALVRYTKSCLIIAEI